MKKYFFLMVAAAFLVALPTQAGLKWGLKAGINLSDVKFEKSDLNPGNYTGFQVGPMAEFTVPIVGIGFDAGLLYSQNGFKLANESYKTGSILIPVNLKYKLSLAGLVGAYATAGPYADFKIHDNLDDFKLPTSGSELASEVKSKSFGAGLNFGLGVELLGKVQVGANYQLGLTDDYKSDGLAGAALNAFSGAKTKVWSITAAVFF